MKQHHLKNALVFMARTTLKAEEISAYNETVAEFKKLIVPVEISDEDVPIESE